MTEIILIDRTLTIGNATLEKVANALQTQISNHFAPIWSVGATVKAGTQVSGKQQAIYIVSELDLPNAYGYHYIDEKAVPYANVLLRDNLAWTITASHELMEMLVNPQLNRFLVTDITIEIPGDEQFLLEVAGPVQDRKYGYKINDILVSNFIYPSYFDILPVSDKKYDYMGLIKTPRSILSGGYVSFTDNVGQWWQAFGVQNKVTLQKLVDGTIDSPNAGRFGRFIAIGLSAGALAYIIYKALSKKKQYGSIR
jgi:hypothetical protein